MFKFCFLYMVLALFMIAGDCFSAVNSVYNVCEFENNEDVEGIKIYRDITELYQNTDSEFVRSGEGSLAIVITEGHSSQADGRAVLDIPLDSSIDMSEFKSLSFWVYVPEELVAYSYGRNDVSIFPNSRDPRYIKAAVEPGWNKVMWDFKDISAFPVMKTLRLVFGPFLAGYGSGHLYVDDIVMHKMNQLKDDDFDMVSQVIAKNKDWTQRYKAVTFLSEYEDVRSVLPLLKAVADGSHDFGVAPDVFTTGQAVAEVETYGSQAVRSAAKDALKIKVEKYGEKLKPLMQEILSSSDMRVRLALINIIEVSSILEDKWVVHAVEPMLVDDSFYVRKAAIQCLQARGYSKINIVGRLTRLLDSGDLVEVLAAARTLSEIGPDAENAVPKLLKIVRNESYSNELRCWALRAVWNTDESCLLPKDWAIVLFLNPGDVHRHLLNVAMNRLEISGDDAVPVLIELLKNSSSEVRIRAAQIAEMSGTDDSRLINILENKLDDEQWSVRWQAAKALKSIEPENTKCLKVLEEIEWFRNKEPQKDIVVTKQGDETLIDNGILQMVFNKNSYNPGPEIVRRGEWGPNLFSAKWIEQMMAFKDSRAENILERSWFQKVFGAPVNKKFEGRLVYSDSDYADYAFVFPATDSVFIEWEQHYVLRRGNSGFYMYITARNVSGKTYEDSVDPRSDNSIGEFRLLLTPTWDIYDTIMMHDKLKGPAKYTFTPQGFMPYPDIYQCTYRVPSGSIDAKHEWDNYELESNVIGLCNQEQGIWFIMPDFDSVDGSMPLLHVNSVNRNMFVIHCEGKYYVNAATKMTADFQKFYGPYYFYINSGDSREELWVDAKRQADQEIANWPYKWVTDKKYHQRGKVKGTVSIDGIDDVEDAWVILSMPRDDAPDDYYGEWLLNTNPYKYWAKTSEDGSFEIDNVMADDYSIFVWKEGVFGELRKDDVTVVENKITEVGNLILNPINKGSRLWQIGIPNRTVTEFKNGNNFHQWDNYIRYQECFPDGVNYTVGKSDYREDWNYIQPAAVKDQWKPTTWTINFDLNKEADSDGLLTIVCIGRYAEMDVIVNDNKVGEIEIMQRRIGANIRSAPYDELYHKEFKVDKELLNEGRNSILLTFDKNINDESDASELHFKKWTSYMAYDFIRFEMLKD